MRIYTERRGVRACVCVYVCMRAHVVKKIFYKISRINRCSYRVPLVSLPLFSFSTSQVYFVSTLPPSSPSSSPATYHRSDKGEKAATDDPLSDHPPRNRFPNRSSMLDVTDDYRRCDVAVVDNKKLETDLEPFNDLTNAVVDK